MGLRARRIRLRHPLTVLQAPRTRLRVPPTVHRVPHTLRRARPTALLRLRTADEPGLQPYFARVFSNESGLQSYELRRRRASLILAEQLRGGLDALQRRRRPDACGSLLAVASRVRAI